MSTIPHGALTRIPGLLNATRWVTHDYWIDNEHVMHGPNVQYQPILPEATTQPIIYPYSAILHSNAGTAKTSWYKLWQYWSRSDIVGEAHFDVAGVDMPATLVQTMPLNRRADCNYKANRFLKGSTYVGAISFETDDRGATTLDQTPWSVGNHDSLIPVWGQVDSMISALTCISVVYGVWCTVPTRWDDSGIGHHCLYPEWSSYIGKTCPGAARIRQMDYIRQQVANNLATISKETGWKCGTGKPV